MGQYYQIVFLDETGKALYSVDPHLFGYGVKLREHCDLKSEVVNTVEVFLLDGGRIVWAGDYADPEKNLNADAADATDLSADGPELKTLYEIADSMPIETKYDPTCENAVVHDLMPETYLINHTKNEYVYVNKNLDDGPHPLVLLTAEGNGRGSGDYFIENEYIGRWARDFISVSLKRPDTAVQLIVDF